MSDDDLKPTVTSSTVESVPVPAHVMLKAIQELGYLPRPTPNWIIIDPTGKAYTGLPEELLPILMKDHLRSKFSPIRF